MTNQQLLQLLGEASDRYVLKADDPPKRCRHRRIGWAAAAACLCLAVGLVAWTLRPAATVMSNGRVEISDLLPKGSINITNELRCVILTVAERTAEYHQTYTSVNDSRLEASLGDAVQGAEGWYRLLGHEEYQYLIHRDEDGCSLWKFAYFCDSGYSYSVVLEKIYGVTSADDIQSITVAPANMDNTDKGQALQKEISTRTITDRADIEAVYQVISGLICQGADRWDLVGLDSDLLEAVRQGRYLTITTTGGLTISSLKYTATAGQFYEFSGVAYLPLDEDTASEIERIFGIG